MNNTQPVPMPVAELADRYTIAILKFDRLPGEEIDKSLLSKQIEYYKQGLPSSPEVQELITDLHKINGQMWDAEHDIRKALDETLGLEEIGRRAIVIRDLNKIRVSIKNQLTKLCGQPEFLDCKMNHASS